MSRDKELYEAQRWLETGNEDLDAARALLEKDKFSHDRRSICSGPLLYSYTISQWSSGLDAGKVLFPEMPYFALMPLSAFWIKPENVWKFE